MRIDTFGYCREEKTESLFGSVKWLYGPFLDLLAGPELRGGVCDWSASEWHDPEQFAVILCCSESKSREMEFGRKLAMKLGRRYLNQHALSSETLLCSALRDMVAEWKRVVNRYWHSGRYCTFQENFYELFAPSFLAAIGSEDGVSLVQCGKGTFYLNKDGRGLRGPLCSLERAHAWPPDFSGGGVAAEDARLFTGLPGFCAGQGPFCCLRLKEAPGAVLMAVPELPFVADQAVERFCTAVREADFADDWDDECCMDILEDEVMECGKILQTEMGIAGYWMSGRKAEQPAVSKQEKQHSDAKLRKQQKKELEECRRRLDLAELERDRLLLQKQGIQGQLEALEQDYQKAKAKLEKRRAYVDRKAAQSRQKEGQHT